MFFTAMKDLEYQQSVFEILCLVRDKRQNGAHDFHELHVASFLPGRLQSGNFAANTMRFLLSTTGCIINNPVFIADSAVLDHAIIGPNTTIGSYASDYNSHS